MVSTSDRSSEVEYSKIKHFEKKLSSRKNVSESSHCQFRLSIEKKKCCFVQNLNTSGFMVGPNPPSPYRASRYTPTWLTVPQMSKTRLIQAEVIIVSADSQVVWCSGCFELQRCLFVL